MLGEHAGHSSWVSVSFDTSGQRGWESVMRVRSPSFPSPRVIPVSSPTWTGLSTHSSSCRIPETTKSSTVSGSPGLGADLLELHSDSRWGALGGGAGGRKVLEAGKLLLFPHFHWSYLPCYSERGIKAPSLAGVLPLGSLLHQPLLSQSPA